jgi:protein SCO1/2
MFKGFSAPWCAPILLAMLVLATANACKSQAQARPSPAMSSADCLPNLTLTDQNGQAVNLAALKGAPVLVDFIYTSCPGPCEMMTQRMTAVASRLGHNLGPKVRFISVTIDPEHDNHQRLRAYARAQGAEHPGWLFLTGDPARITSLMSAFNLQRVREADGSIDHVLSFFLIRPDGSLQSEYCSLHTPPDLLAGDINNLISRG